MKTATAQDNAAGIKTADQIPEGQSITRGPVRLQGIMLLRQDAAIDSSDVISVESVDPIGGPPLPADGLSLLYGMRNSLETLGAYNRIAKQHGARAIQIEATCNVARDTTNSARLDQLPHLDFLHVGRLQKDTRDLIRSYWAKYMKKDPMVSQGEFDRAFGGSSGALSFIAQHPTYFSQLRHEPEFKNIRIFAYPVVSSLGAEFRATIFDPSSINEMNLSGYPSVKEFELTIGNEEHAFKSE